MSVGYSSNLFSFTKPHLNSTLVFTRQTAGNYSSIIAYLHVKLYVGKLISLQSRECFPWLFGRHSAHRGPPSRN